ncbi:MAG: alpha/beta hydrolase [Limnochordales bacterium]|nr:alpha/beta hydrolase [Limnochordales bacterium]
MRREPLRSPGRLGPLIRQVTRAPAARILLLSLSLAAAGICLFDPAWGFSSPADSASAPPGSRATRLTVEQAEQDASANIRVIRDLTYAAVDDKALLLDLYLPSEQTGPYPLIVWVHGGGWRSGSKENPRLALTMVSRGYAVASINYRLSHEAIFPAQIQDVKAAIRWLRANAAAWDLDPDRIGAWGSSAGGHLVALLGTSAGVDLFEQVGDHQDQSSRVQAVVDFYGPIDFLQMDSMLGRRNQWHSSPSSSVSLFLGGPALQNREKALAASPLSYITPDDPPFLIVHGKEDRIVPYQQSVLFYEALRRAGIEATLILLSEAGHGGPAFNDPQLLDQVASFFDRHLREVRPRAGEVAPSE